jgi:hypothetical protein
MHWWGLGPYEGGFGGPVSTAASDSVQSTDLGTRILGRRSALVPPNVENGFSKPWVGVIVDSIVSCETEFVAALISAKNAKYR